MFYSTFANRFRTFYKKASSDVSLTDSEIHILQEQSKHGRLYYAESGKTSAENMAGDLQSRLSGSGVDFEENKPYQAGNDSRYINWRTYARTQQLYINIYNEDKRPSLYVVLDQRSNMYFGTRKQLKIKQALNIAVFSIFRAIQQQYTVAGMQILSKPRWYAAHNSQRAALSFIKTLILPLINKTENTNEPALNDILNKLQLKEGAELIVISDFHDMDDKTIAGLYAISRKHKINLIQVLDPVEVELPVQGRFDIKGTTDSEPLLLDCNKKKIKTQYKDCLNKKFNRHKSQCHSMGVQFARYLTTDDIYKN